MSISSSSSSSSSSYFETLPTEILRAILAYSPSSTALSLIQTNSTIHERAELLLYENITWNIERTYEQPTMHLLLSQLLLRPSIGLWIRSFTMTGRFDQKTYTGLTRAEVSLLYRRVAEKYAGTGLMDGYEVEEWWQLIFASSPLMLVSLLILLCPNITTLQPWSGYDQPPQRLTFLARAMSTLPSLTSVEYATAYSKFPSIPITHNSLTFLFQIPSLRRLTLQVTEDVNLSAAQRTALPMAPQIRDLKLHSSMLSCATVGEIVGRLPSLRGLELGLLRETHPYTADSVAAGSFIDCVSLAKALLIRAGEIERLTISSEFYLSRDTHRNLGGSYDSGRDGNPGTLRYWGTQGTLGDSLRAFSKLRYLEVDPVVLFGWDVLASPCHLRAVLPTRLKMLKLRADFVGCRDWKGSVPWVRDLVKGYFEDVKASGGGGGKGMLEGIVLQVWDSHAMRYVEALDELEVLCSKEGVLFGVETLLG